MTSSPETTIMDALARHRRHALTTSELAARTALPEPLVHATATGDLRAVASSRPTSSAYPTPTSHR